MWKERTHLGMVVDLMVVKHVRRLKGQVLIGTQRGAAQDHMGLGEQEQCSDKQHWPCHLCLCFSVCTLSYIDCL